MTLLEHVYDLGEFGDMHCSGGICEKLVVSRRELLKHVYETIQWHRVPLSVL